MNACANTMPEPATALPRWPQRLRIVFAVAVLSAVFTGPAAVRGQVDARLTTRLRSAGTLAQGHVVPEGRVLLPAEVQTSLTIGVLLLIITAASGWLCTHAFAQRSQPGSAAGEPSSVPGSILADDQVATMLNATVDGFIVIDERGTIQFFNAHAERCFGYAAEEVLGKNVSMLMPAPMCDEHDQYIIRYLHTGRGSIIGRGREVEGRRRDGTTFPIYLAVNETTFGKQRRFIGIIRDITEQRQMQDALRESEARFRGAFEHAPIGMALVSPTGQWLKVNPALCEIVGYNAEELLAIDRRALCHPGDYDRHLEAERRLLAGSIDNYSLEKRYLHKQGHVVWVLLSVSLVRRPDGERHYFILQIQDITERKRAEQILARTNEDLQRSNRELQEFAYVASHDLQEPLRKVQAFGDRLQSKYGALLDAQGRDYLMRMKGAAERMRMLIQDLLTYSRVTTSDHLFEPVFLNQVVADVLADLEVPIAESQARIELGDLPTIEAGSAQMRQLLQNLVGNALKFRRVDVPTVIRIHGHVGQTDEDGRQWCQVTVADNGIGFDERYVERIFGVFQRLHSRDQYPGAGIGLSLCKKIVDHHHGQISVTSTPGEGSVFTIRLPIRQHDRAGAAPTDEQALLVTPGASG